MYLNKLKICKGMQKYIFLIFLHFLEKFEIHSYNPNGIKFHALLLINIVFRSRPLIVMCFT